MFCCDRLRRPKGGSFQPPPSESRQSENHPSKPFQAEKASHRKPPFAQLRIGTEVELGWCTWFLMKLMDVGPHAASITKPISMGRHQLRPKLLHARPARLLNGS